MIINSQAQRFNQNMAAKVAKNSNADGIAVFLYDRSKQVNAATFVYCHRIPEGLSSLYSRSLCKLDPLLPHEGSHELTMGEIRHSMEASFRPSDTKTIKQYWQHLLAEDYKETAACFQQLSSTMCLVIGLHMLAKSGERKHLQLDPVLDCLEDWLKQSSDQLITQSLNQYSQCTATMSDSSSRINIDACSGHHSGADDTWGLLTKRQRQLVEILLCGKSNKQISRELNLSDYTVENHLRSIYRKFGVNNRTALAARFRH